jgi:asparagine synthase (glutamine-hydrolysing)
VRLRRYWKLPTDGDVRYRCEAEYVEHFRHLLGRAVEDRLRTDWVAVYMSGGLDSSSVAAAARRLTPAGDQLNLWAYTQVYEGLMPDEERHYAGLVARELNIPITYQPVDAFRLFEFQDDIRLHPPEPYNAPLAAPYNADQYRQTLAHARVALTGQGGDPAFLGSSVYTLELLKRGRLGRLAVDLWRSLRRGRLPQVGFRARLRRWWGKTWVPPYPTWLNRDFETQLGLGARWQEVNAPPPREHPRRPEAYGSLTSPFWPVWFELWDPGVTLCPFEVRHPFFDVRLLTYALAIPAVPWCPNKELLRSALCGLVPEEVRLRPKTFLWEDPVAPRLRREDLGWIDGFDACPELDRFVDRRRIPRLAGETNAERFVLNARPYCLNYWLRLVARSQRRPEGLRGLQGSARAERARTAPVSKGVDTLP